MTEKEELKNEIEKLKKIGRLFKNLSNTRSCRV